MSDSAITILIAALIAVAVMTALVMMIVQHGQRTAAAVARQDAKARAEHDRQCHCPMSPATHQLCVWLVGRADPLQMTCAANEAHRAYHEIKLQTGLYTWRGEFIFDPTVSVLGADGSLTDVVVPQVQAVALLTQERVT